MTETDETQVDETPQPFYSHVEEFVTERFVPMFPRPLGGQFRWCARWWEHAEAISRFTALWHAWEMLRLEPGVGTATWYREHLDHQLPIIMGERGPFYQCTEEQHIEPELAPVEPSPPTWWDLPDSESDEDEYDDIPGEKDEP